MNYKILVQYDGTRYEGWQRQERTESTIQGKIEAVLSKMCGEEVQIQGAGRTDAGVHAKEQVANVHLKEQVDPQEVKQYLNRYLPEDIAVSEVTEVPERFHSRLNATGKIYVYRIATGEVKKVFERRYIYDFGEKPDVHLMRQAAEILAGTHDFKSFCANRRMKKSTVRTIYSIDLKEKEGEIVINIHRKWFSASYDPDSYRNTSGSWNEKEKSFLRGRTAGSQRPRKGRIYGTGKGTYP